MKKLNLSLVSYIAAGLVAVFIVLFLVGQHYIGLGDFKTYTVFYSASSILFMLTLGGVALYTWKATKPGAPLQKLSFWTAILMGVILIAHVALVWGIPQIDGIKTNIDALITTQCFSASVQNVLLFVTMLFFLTLSKLFNQNKAIKTSSRLYLAMTLTAVVLGLVGSYLNYYFYANETFVEAAKHAHTAGFWLSYLPSLLQNATVLTFFATLGYQASKYTPADLEDVLNNDKEYIVSTERKTAIFCGIGAIILTAIACVFTCVAYGKLQLKDAEGILILGIGGVLIAHMLIELIGTKKLTPMSAESNKALRQQQGLQPTTKAEAADLIQQMDDILTQWTPYTDDQGQQMYVMTKSRQVSDTLELLERIEAEHPDDEEVVARFNELANSYNESIKREYNGSTPYIVLAAIVAVLVGWLSEHMANMLLLIGSQIVIYIMACMSPMYILNNAALKQSNPRFMNGFIAGIFGLSASAATYKITTTYSDGSKTTEYDNSEHLIALIISIVVFIFITFFMFIPALVNYLRNYVLRF